MRPSLRDTNVMRPIRFERQYTQYAEGSVLAVYGQTQVLCTVSVIHGVPRFIKGAGKGWLTAEYGMLPRATNQRTDRESVKGKQSGRTYEIQRLIGRSLRNCVDLDRIGENTLVIDCDVIQADGGTRTAAITGSCVALYDACSFLEKKLKLSSKPFKKLIAAVSVGIYQDKPILDLDYAEDSNAETDMNVVMDQFGNFIEIQGTAEKISFHKDHLDNMLALAQKGIGELITHQKTALQLEV
jgi:ribonuclease PH